MGSAASTKTEDAPATEKTQPEIDTMAQPPPNQPVGAAASATPETPEVVSTER